MKIFNFPKTFPAVIAAAGLTLSAMTVGAQNSAPLLSYGVPQVLQLAQAKVSDATVIAYIRNSGTSYNLTADQIIYLRQQGVSDDVLNVMLTQPKPAVAPAPTAPLPDNSYQAQTPANYAPSTAPAYVQSAPSTVYVVPNSQTYYYNNYSQPYYYPYSYSYFPSVSLAFAFGSSSYYHGGGYYYGGGGYHGGYPSGGGGYHGGGSYHGSGMMGGGMHH